MANPPKPPSLGQNTEFDLARKRAAQGETAALQTQKDALARRAAQLGGGVSGALVKQENIASDQSARRLADVNEGIGAAERQEGRRIAEIKEGRDFARAEREATQKFASGESALGRKFAADEALKGREFQSLEAGYARHFQNKLTNKDMAFRKGLAEADMSFRQKVFDSQTGFAKEQFEWEKYIDEKNLDLARRIQRANEKNPGILGSIFGDKVGFTGADVIGGGGGGGGGILSVGGTKII